MKRTYEEAHELAKFLGGKNQAFQNDDGTWTVHDLEIYDPRKDAAVTDTPKTSRPSEAIQRYETKLDWGGNGVSLVRDSNGTIVLHSDHLAALARARDEARREALEEAKKQANERAEINRGFRVVAAISRDYHRAADFASAQVEALTISEMIRDISSSKETD